MFVLVVRITQENMPACLPANNASSLQFTMARTRGKMPSTIKPSKDSYGTLYLEERGRSTRRWPRRDRQRTRSASSTDLRANLTKHRVLTLPLFSFARRPIGRLAPKKRLHLPGTQARDPAAYPGHLREGRQQHQREPKLTGQTKCRR